MLLTSRFDHNGTISSVVHELGQNVSIVHSQVTERRSHDITKTQPIMASAKSNAEFSLLYI